VVIAARILKHATDGDRVCFSIAVTLSEIR